MLVVGLECGRELQVFDGVLVAAVHFCRQRQRRDHAQQCLVHLLRRALEESTAARCIRPSVPPLDTLLQVGD
jgi:hypothetical protein